nr:hypothetical protein [Tanacetum cinerariifolium]
MDRLPSNIILDIFSRVPVKYLARSRCVSKVWCKYIDDPYLVIIHDKRGVDEPTPILSYPMVHSLRKECYELPPFPLRFGRDMDRESCGLGFDTSTNTWKMVCVLLKEYAPPDNPDMVKKNLCTMVNVFGTNSWRVIPRVSYYPLTGKAVFANGRLHWLASYSDFKTRDGGQEVIWFDVNKEEFGLIERPKRMCDKWTYFLRDKLVDLNDGDILIRSICGNPVGAFYVYNLKSSVLHKTNLAGSDACPGIFIKERYELPPFPLRFENHMRRESCGLGFDAFTNTYKMVCVLLKEYAPPNKPDMVKKNLCTIVHVFGTNSWREIPQVLSYPITGKAVFVNGCLHWLLSHLDIKTEDGGREVIWFDVNKEEFRLIDPPKIMCDLWSTYNCYYDHLVDLNGEVGYVCCRTMEVWVLNK